MTIAELVRALAAAGASSEAIAIAVEAVEAAQGEVVRQREAARDRKRRQRAMKADCPATVTGQSRDTDGTERDPSPSEVSPHTPLPTNPNHSPLSPPIAEPIEGRTEAPSEPTGRSTKPRRPTKAELDAIWAETPRPGRERSSRADLERAVTAAMRRGHEPGAILAGVRAAYAAPTMQGDFAKGVHRLVENDRWQSFVEPEPQPEVEREDDAWPVRIKAWAKDGFWTERWGPKPDQPGTRVPAHLLTPKAA